MSDVAITRYDAMRSALVAAHSIDDVKEIRDKAEALRQYARQAGESLENQNMIAEIKLRAERRAGELLREMPKNEGGRPTEKTSNTVLPVLDSPTLDDLGITKIQSSRFQAIAAIPEPVFEAQILETKAANLELTSASMLRVAQELRREQEKADRQASMMASREDALASGEVRCRLYVARAETIPLDDMTVDVIVTSPPYNLGDDTWPMGGRGNAPRDGIGYVAHSDDMPQDEYEQWQIEVLRELYRVAKPGASLFYNHKARTVGGRVVHPMQWLMLPDNPWTLRQEVIWDRKSTHNHNATLFWPIDERIYWMTKGAPVLRSNSIGQPTVWQEFGPIADTWHPAPFTDKLPRMLLEAVGVDGETVVLDPFAGSCTTVRVALELGCEAIGVDVSREYLERACIENGWNRGLIS